MRVRRRLVFLASFYRAREGNTRRRGPVSFPVLLRTRPRNFSFRPEKKLVTQATLQNTHKDFSVTACEIYFF